MARGADEGSGDLALLGNFARQTFLQQREDRGLFRRHQRSISPALNHYYDWVKSKQALYVGAFVLEAIVLVVLWLVGRHFSVP